MTDAQRRAELKAAYQEIPVYYGVVRLTNMRDGMVFVAGFPNLKNREHVLRMQLDDGKHPNVALQAAWNEDGSEAFNFEVLEQHDASKVADARYAAKALETHYLEGLLASGTRNYHVRA